MLRNIITAYKTVCEGYRAIADWNEFA